MFTNAPEYAKAIVTFAYLVASALALVITGDQGFDAITPAQWVGVIIYVAGGTGLVYAVPNREQ